MSKWKKLSSLKKAGLIAAMIYVISVGIFIIAVVPSYSSNIQTLDSLSQDGGDFSTHLMGLSILDPYERSKKAVIFSDTYGNPYIDGTRTTWDYDPNVDPDKYFDNIRVGGTTTDRVNDYNGWTYGVQDDFSDWCVGNYWYAPTGATIDPDAKNTGVPNLGISLANMYPSDSNGNPSNDYGYTHADRILVDSLGNERDIELGIGFITMELVISIESNMYIGAVGNTVEVMMCEAPGHFNNIGFEQAYGATLDFEAVFRVQIHSLDFGDGWFLNPDWLNFGNGIMGVYKRGFTAIEDTEGESYIIATQDTTNWSPFPGYNDIEETQVAQLDRFISKENAIDHSNIIPADDSSSNVQNFKDNTPTYCYFNLHNFVELGMTYDIGVLGTKLDTLFFQKIIFTQRVTIEFYTSVCEPLGGTGHDPVQVIVDITDPPPRERLWDRIMNWFAELLGIKKEQAELIAIIIICVIALIVILMIFPQLIPMIGKGLAFIPKKVIGAIRKARS